MVDCEKIGTRVRYYRKKNNMSQEELAECTSSSRVYISNIERGEIVPSLEAIINIANVLYVSTDELLAENLIICTPTRSEEEMDILYDCTKEESLILLESMRAIKNVIRGYKITK